MIRDQFQYDETGRATLPPAEVSQAERDEDRARMGVFGWFFGTFVFVFAAVSVWAVWG